jgi:hypothetical protein
LKTLKILAAAGIYLLSLAAPPCPEAITTGEVPEPSVETLAGQLSRSHPAYPENLTAIPILYLPSVFKDFPPPPGILFVLINNFLLFVPAPQ